jgi:hypothetical protein
MLVIQNWLTAARHVSSLFIAGLCFGFAALCRAASRGQVMRVCFQVVLGARAAEEMQDRLRRLRRAPHDLSLRLGRTWRLGLCAALVGNIMAVAVSEFVFRTANVSLDAHAGPVSPLEHIRVLNEREDVHGVSGVQPRRRVSVEPLPRRSHIQSSARRKDGVPSPSRPVRPWEHHVCGNWRQRIWRCPERPPNLKCSRFAEIRDEQRYECLGGLISVDGGMGRRWIKQQPGALGLLNVSLADFDGSLGNLVCRSGGLGSFFGRLPLKRSEHRIADSYQKYENRYADIPSVFSTKVFPPFASTLRHESTRPADNAHHYVFGVSILIVAAAAAFHGVLHLAMGRLGRALMVLTLSAILVHAGLRLCLGIGLS